MESPEQPGSLKRRKTERKSTSSKTRAEANTLAEVAINNQERTGQAVAATSAASTAQAALRAAQRHISESETEGENESRGEVTEDQLTECGLQLTLDKVSSPLGRIVKFSRKLSNLNHSNSILDQP